MRYVDAGYAIALTVLTVYAVGLFLRRRRLSRAAAVAGLVPPEPGRPAHPRVATGDAAAAGPPDGGR